MPLSTLLTESVWPAVSNVTLSAPFVELSVAFTLKIVSAVARIVPPRSEQE